MIAPGLACWLLSLDGRQVLATSQGTFNRGAWVPHPFLVIAPGKTRKTWWRVLSLESGHTFEVSAEVLLFAELLDG